MIEAKTNANRNNLFSRINGSAREVFPEIQQMMAMPTGDTTALVTAVYQDEAAAKRAISQRDKEFEKSGFELEIAFEGPLKGYYYNDIISTVK